MSIVTDPSIPATGEPSVSGPTWAWYSVHTHPRREFQALENLDRQGYEAYLPTLTLQKVRRGKAQMVTEALFARYLFVRLDSSMQGRSWSPIRSTLGVRSLVQFGGRPARVSEDLVEWLRAREREAPAQALFAPGDTVVVAAGPFKGFEAMVTGTDAEQRAMVLLEFLSRPVTLRVDPAHLERIGA